MQSIVYAAALLSPFALIAGISFYLHGKRMKRMRSRNYQWYRARYPQAVRGKRVFCRSCEGDSISVRNVMQRTFMREHFCSQCGECLYYSPEGAGLTPAD